MLNSVDTVEEYLQLIVGSNKEIIVISNTFKTVVSVLIVALLRVTEKWSKTQSSSFVATQLPIEVIISTFCLQAVITVSTNDGNEIYKFIYDFKCPYLLRIYILFFRYLLSGPFRCDLLEHCDLSGQKYGGHRLGFQRSFIGFQNEHLVCLSDLCDQF